MYIKRKPLAAFYKLLVGALALVTEWFILGEYGLEALRLFPTWILFIGAIYFLSSALLLALSHGKESGKNPCPMLEGMVIMSFLLISGVGIVTGGSYLSILLLQPWMGWVVSVALPILVFLDWALFVKKGRWKPMYPFYWLALPVFYMAMMMFTAEFLPESAMLRYPLSFFNYREFGLDQLFIYTLLILVIMLSVGYILYLFDFALSGKLGKKIVMPHLQTVIVDENGREIAREPVFEPEPEVENEGLEPEDSAVEPKDEPDLESEVEARDEKASADDLQEQNITSPVEVINMSVETETVEAGIDSLETKSKRTSKSKPSKSKSDSAETNKSNRHTGKPSPKSKQNSKARRQSHRYTKAKKRST